MSDPCQFCPWRSRPVMGQGPRPCSTLFFGEGPGRVEHAKGIPFCGDSGRELDRLYLPLAGLSRPEVYVSNVCKCFQGGDNPTDDQALACSRRHIMREIREVQPDIIITLGAVANRVLFPGCDLMLEHGLPRLGAVLNPELGDWTGLHVAMYHPAAGLRDSRWMAELVGDFSALKRIVLGDWSRPKDQHPQPRYLASRPEPGYRIGDPVAVDTEVVSLESMEPWCLSFSDQEGTAQVILADDIEALVWFADAIARYRLLVLLHNGLFDLPVLRKMKVPIPGDRFVDTMAMAYHQGFPPWQQGLKVLAHRLCGMKMRDFEEVVWPGSVAALKDYVDGLIQDPIFAYSRRPQDKSLLRRLKRLSLDLDCGRSPDPWDRIKKWDPLDLNRMAQLQDGVPVPFPSIRYVDREGAIWYAGRDADATLRVYHALRRRAGERLSELNWGIRNPDLIPSRAGGQARAH